MSVIVNEKLSQPSSAEPRFATIWWRSCEFSPCLPSSRFASFLAEIHSFEISDLYNFLPGQEERVGPGAHPRRFYKWTHSTNYWRFQVFSTFRRSMPILIEKWPWSFFFVRGDDETAKILSDVNFRMVSRDRSCTFVQYPYVTAFRVLHSGSKQNEDEIWYFTRQMDL